VGFFSPVSTVTFEPGIPENLNSALIEHSSDALKVSSTKSSSRICHLSRVPLYSPHVYLVYLASDEIDKGSGLEDLKLLFSRHKAA